MKKVKLILLAVLIFVLLRTDANAAAKTPDPDPSANTMLAGFMKEGAKVYYMGERLGLNGWFLAKDNQIQMVYTLPNNQGALIGVLFDKDGQSVSAQQLKSLYDSNKDVSGFFAALNNPAMPAAAGMLTADQMQAMAPAFTGVMPAASVPPPALMPDASPGERLVQALQAAGGVNLGAATAHQLFMIADPNCPHCQATWRLLRTAVFGGTLKIRLVPIGAIDPDSERASAQLLDSANPLEAWDKYISGDNNQLAGMPNPSALQAVRANHALIEAWKIQQTPYLVYRAKDGTVKILQGEMKDASVVLNDIGP